MEEGQTMLSMKTVVADEERSVHHRKAEVLVYPRAEQIAVAVCSFIELAPTGLKEFVPRREV